METFKVKAILCAVKHQSLSKAAEELSYTPSAFSHMLTAFEHELGVTLFTRSSRGVVLTDEGEQLYASFTALAAREEELWNTIRKIKGRNSPSLRIASFSSLSRYLLSDFLKFLKREYPHIDVSISVADNVTGFLEQDKADIVFADSRCFESQDWLPLFSDEYCVIAPKGTFDNKPCVTIKELYKHPYVYTDDFYLDGYFDKNNFKELIVFRSEDDLSIANMVRDGFGVSVLPRLVTNDVSHDLDVIPLEPAVTRVLGIAYKKDTIESLGLSSFLTNYRHKIRKKAEKVHPSR